ncbi:hypothetical protein F3Y22_tig00112206pilonHSYRG00219 [Hibiscus syriacus]|uniref:Endosomal targeting BRO1-like domain-containing protein n=1 Tax=Hibiscus syriacus TaxID=106335 RepID=A0A6A2XJR4_HIBSY|nr:hypothetical protein F3Y22_tig00112206pilonHSYRG00219 [Hibiscus syriacus]
MVGGQVPQSAVHRRTEGGRKWVPAIDPDVAGGARRRPKNIGESVVFGRSRAPMTTSREEQPHTRFDDFFRTLIVSLVIVRCCSIKHRSYNAGGSTLTDLQQALEDYLPVLLGLVENGTISVALDGSSIVHKPIMLLPNKSTAGYQNTSLEAGYLDFAVQKVLPQLPLELRNDLPLDLTEGVLKSLCLQALGQGVEIQLGMAIDSIKATLAVKRRLACEMVKYWHQAHEYIKDLPLANGWGESTSFSFSGSILKLSGSPSSMSISRKQKGLILHWGASKYLAEKIPKDVPSKTINWDSQKHELIMQIAPALPDFALSLKPDEYQLPSMDPSWKA